MDLYDELYKNQEAVNDGSLKPTTSFFRSAWHKRWVRAGLISVVVCTVLSVIYYLNSPLGAFFMASYVAGLLSAPFMLVFLLLGINNAPLLGMSLTALILLAEFFGLGALFYGIATLFRKPFQEYRGTLPVAGIIFSAVALLSAAQALLSEVIRQDYLLYAYVSILLGIIALPLCILGYKVRPKIAKAALAIIFIAFVVSLSVHLTLSGPCALRLEQRERDDCYGTLVRFGNPSGPPIETCAKIEDQEWREQCVNYVAAKTQDETICSIIQTPIELDDCHRVARKNHPDVCETMSTEDNKGRCYVIQACENNDPSLCAKAGEWADFCVTRSQEGNRIPNNQYCPSRLKYLEY